MIALSEIFADSSENTAEMQSKESLDIKNTENSKKEHNNIKNEYELSEEDLRFENSFVQSVEAEDDEPTMDEDGDMNFDDEMDSLDDAMDNAGDDSGSDGGFDDSGSDGGTGGNTGSAGGVDDLDLNKGSSLNTFTQINQKLYFIDSLNKLLTSIRNTVSRYNDIYTDWSELNQLKDLADIVDDERNSFVMQENPENLIKLRLYQEQYKAIVDRLSVLISEKAKNSKV